MSVQTCQYEELLCRLSNAPDALALLRDYRPYFEKIPSIRRPTDSIVPIPLPTVRVRQPRMREVSGLLDNPYERLQLSCDIALLMCDPDWQIKNSEEIFIFIHRPGEEFSNLLRRWRMTQVALGSEYLWDMPLGYEHMLSEGSDKKYPLFILLEESHDRICRGLQGARLPYICQSVSCEDPAPASMVEAAP